MKRVEINVKDLYEAFGRDLYYCYIEFVPKGSKGNNEDYYELYKHSGEFMCLNSEFCIVEKHMFHGGKLFKSNETSNVFYLSEKEVVAATQHNLKQPDVILDDLDDWFQAV